MKRKWLSLSLLFACLSVFFFSRCVDNTDLQIIDPTPSAVEMSQQQDLSLQKVSGGYVQILKRTRVGKVGGYTYEAEIYVDKTGHNVAGCSAFNGKKHLNIKVWSRKGSGSWKTENDLHILTERGCVVYVHDTRAGIKCKEMNFCSDVGTIGRAVSTAVYVYVVRKFLVDIIVSNWTTILLI